MPSGRVTLREVAESAGVNPGTASRVLNPHTRGLVKAETARRVEAAARRLGYEPNRAARSLRTRRSHSVGVIIPDFTNPLFPPMVRGIEDTLAPAGYTALLTNTDGDEERAKTAFETLRGRQVDGFILATAAREDPLVTLAMEEELAFVLVNRTVDRKGVSAVVPDDRGGVDQVVRYLHDLGHTAIGYVAGPQSVSTGLVRYRGFLEAMDARGLEVTDRSVVFCANYTEGAGAAAARELLEAWPGCTAVLAANDLAALGVYDVAQELGYRCPDRLSVVGFNDMPFADKFNPPLTTVSVPVYDLGVRSAELLLERLGSESPHPHTVVLDTQLVVRGSTAPPGR